MKMGVGAYFRGERKDPRMPSFLSSLNLAASRPCSNVTTQEPSLIPYPELMRVHTDRHTHTHTRPICRHSFSLFHISATQNLTSVHFMWSLATRVSVILGYV